MKYYYAKMETKHLDLVFCFCDEHDRNEAVMKIDRLCEVKSTHSNIRSANRSRRWMPQSQLQYGHLWIPSDIPSNVLVAVA